MLLERQHLLDELGGRLDAAASGAGSLVLIDGEAGAGKSSLVRAFVDSLGRSADVLEGGCDPLSTPRPLSPLRDMASDPAWGLADLPLVDHDGIEVFQAVLGRLTGSDRPTVMIVEDVHWADMATLDLLTYLGRRIGPVPAVLVVTSRHAELGADHPTRTVLGQLAALDTTVRLAVPPLSLEAVRLLVTDDGVDAGALHRLTGGNAFFVTEVVATGSMLPPTVHEAVLARVAALAPGQRAVVEAVSIAPRSLSIDRAIGVAGGRVGDVDGAVESGVLQVDGSLLQFRHDLARSAVEQSIPPARRHAMHREMIELALAEPTRDHALLAHHAVEARDPQLIAAHAPRAAEDARASGALREARALASTALDQAELLDGAEAARLRLSLAGDLTRLDEAEEAAVLADRAARDFQALGDETGEARAMVVAGRAYYGLGRLDEAQRRYRAAVDRLEPGGPSDALAEALNTVAHHAMLARRAGPGLEVARRAEQVAAAVGSRSTQLAVRHTRACLELITGDSDAGLDRLASVVAESEAVDWQLHGSALVNLGSGAGEVRRYDLALEALGRAERYGIDHDLDESVAYCRSWLARVAFEQGRWDDAVAHAELVERTAGNRAGFALLTARGAIGRVRVRRGDPGGSELLARALADGGEHSLQYLWPLRAGLAEACWLGNDLAGMVSALEEPYAAAVGTDSAWAKGELGYWMWRAGAIDTPPAGAAEPFAHQIAGGWRRAATAWRALGCPYETASALADGDPAARLEALAIADGLGARPLADRLRAELRHAGVDRVPRGPSAATRHHPLGLTSRQAEVLALVAAGDSNGEIAQRLYLSKKTVEHHVSAIYARLGVTTRREAIEAARRADGGGDLGVGETRYGGPPR